MRIEYHYSQSIYGVSSTHRTSIQKNDNYVRFDNLNKIKLPKEKIKIKNYFIVANGIIYTDKKGFFKKWVPFGIKKYFYFLTH